MPRSTIEVSEVANGNVRLAVSHTDDRVDSYTSKFCTGVELPADLWRQAIAEVEAMLPPADTAAEAAALGDPFDPEPGP